MDPDVLPIDVVPADGGDACRFDRHRFAPWLYVIIDPQGREHAVISDGYRRIRFDVQDGSLACGQPMLLRYAVEGMIGPYTEAGLLPLRRLASLLRTGRFLPALFPAERRIERLVPVLRVADALSAGATQRDIAAVLFGNERISSDWRTVSDSLRSRVRRLVREARHMVEGGYRGILRRGHSRDG